MKNVIFGTTVTTLLFFAGATTSFAKSDTAGAGWFAPQVEYLGEDTLTCGPNSAVGRIALYDAESDLPVVPNGFSWEVRIDRENINLPPKQTLSGLTTSVSPTFCFQMSEDRIFVHVNGSGPYRETFTPSVGLNPKNVAAYNGKSFLGKVFLRPDSSPADLLLSPTPQILAVDPQYNIVTNSLLNKYGATQIDSTTILVRTQASPYVIVGQNTYTNSVGVGNNTFGALGLPDGYFYWYASQRLNGSVTLGGGNNTSELPNSGIAGPDFFILDTVAPETLAYHAVISTSTEVAEVEISNITKDVTSGLFYTELTLIDTTVPTTGTVTNSFDFGIFNTEVTVTVPVSLEVGHVYNYYFTTYDWAGHSVVSPVGVINTGDFNSSAPTPVPPVTTIDLPTPSPLVYQAGDPNINFKASAVAGDSGTPISPSELNWEWRTGNCTTGSVYSNAHDFSTTTVGNQIAADGTPVSVYVRAQEIATGLWSENCQSINITINCPVDSPWDSSVNACVTPPPPEPDLESQALSVDQTAPFTVGDNITFNANVVNVGLTDTPVGFIDRFSYSFDGAAWTPVNNLNHSPLPAGNTEPDSGSLTLGQAGQLTIRHEVDVADDVSEPSGINYTEVGPYTVKPMPTGWVTAVGCAINQSDSTCNVGLDWLISNADTPNLYNQTTGNVYSNDASNPNSPAPTEVPLPPGTYTFEAREDTDFLGSAVVTVGCAGGTYWSTSGCVLAPAISFTPPTQFVRYNTAADIEVKITSAESLNCTITGAKTPNITFAHTGSEAEIAYPYQTDPLTATKNMTVQCSNGVSSTETQTIKVEVLPNSQEI